jgi:protein-ribulosamine 3-kinase
MNQILNNLEEKLGEKIKSTQAISGGSIADARLIEMESGKKYFLKTGAHSPKMFRAEANGLKEIEKAGVIRVPHIFVVEPDFLLMEYIRPSTQKAHFFERFGRQFAELHNSKSAQFGFFEDNFIGHTLQENRTNERQATDWRAFYFEKRLLFQFKLAESKNRVSEKLSKGFALLENKIESILSNQNEPPTLLHGDLWSGNFLADENGLPVLVDPAVYYGHREADLAMTKLFGGFPGSFYGAYQEVLPLAEGAGYRENIYKLYHVLNHLNLFGFSYQAQAEELVWFYL